MEQLKNMPKPYLIGGGVIIALLIVIIVLMSGGKKEEAQANPTEPQVAQEEPEAIPTVDPSVKVAVEAMAGNKVSIEVDGVPDGTDTIDYELSYDTSDKGMQGVIGQLEINGDKAAPDEEIFLGTCSSGTCISHNVTGSTKVTLHFSGTYGEQLFEEEYELE